MAYQTGRNVLVAIKRETTIGTAPGATGAKQLLVTDSPGLTLARAQIQSGLRRNDAVKPLGRLGGKSATGSYNGEFVPGGALDDLLESIIRGAWSASAALVTCTGAGTFTSLQATAADTLTLVGGGSFLTQGVRVGDVVRLTNANKPANSNLNLRVAAVAAGTLTLAGTPLTIETAPSTTAVLTRLGKVITPASPVRSSYGVEQYDVDIDASELFLGCRLVGLQITGRPGQPVTWQATFQGLDRQVLSSASAPYFTGPTVPTGLSLVADDSAIRFNGADVATITGFTLNFQITAAGQPVIGSFVSPDIFDNDLAVTGQVTGLRSDLSKLTLYDAETEFDFSVLLVEPGAAPQPCIGIFLPRVKISAPTAPAVGGDAAKIETLDLMVGPKDAATGYDATVAAIFSSAQ